MNWPDRDRTVRISDIYFSPAGPFDDGFQLGVNPGEDQTRADTILLTGPNGAGKSTILFAIASCFGSYEEFVKRARTEQAITAIRIESASGTHTLAASSFTKDTLRDPFDGDSELKLALTMSNKRRVWASDGPAMSLWKHLQQPDSTTVSEDVALVFSYSSMRSFESGKSDPLGEFAGSALAQAASFGLTNRAETFERWVSLNLTKRAVAHEAGDAAAANRYRSGLRSVEEAISQIMGAEFRFTLQTEPFAVLAKTGGSAVPLSVLPDGLRSILSWIGDLMMRLERLEHEGPAAELPFVLLLDEIEAHLHPLWQRQVLPVVEKLFPNAQIFLSSHSPFVIGTAIDTQIIALDSGKVKKRLDSQSGRSYAAIATEVMGLDADFDPATEKKLDAFDEQRAAVMAGNGTLSALEELAAELSKGSEELAITLRFQIERVRTELEHLS